MKIIRHHQQTVRLLQPFWMLLPYRRQLIDRVKNLFLDSCSVVEFFLRDMSIHFFIHALCPAVAEGCRISDTSSLPIQKDIVHRPGVNGKALNFRELCKGFPDALLHVEKQAVDVPFQMTVHPMDAIGKTVHFLGAENTVLHPSYNVPPAGRTNVDGKIAFVHNAPPVWL